MLYKKCAQQGGKASFSANRHVAATLATKISVLILASFSLGAALTPTLANDSGGIPCVGLKPRGEMVTCMVSEGDKSDQAIAEMLLIAQSKADAEHKVFLDQSQAAWVGYVEKECQLEGDAYRNRPTRPQQIFACEIVEGRRRLKQIRVSIDWSVP